MKKILNFGSLNVDKVYQVPHIVKAGETISSDGYRLFSGGKGLNQSIALAKSGLLPYHAGAVGCDGQMLLEELEKGHVNTAHILRLSDDSGHTIIQVDPSGQNCIIVDGGANQQITEAHIDQVLSDFAKGDYLLLQNEISSMAYLIKRAKECGMKIILNPSPANEKLNTYPLHLVDLFILNEVEGEVITGETAPDQILSALLHNYPDADILLTLGTSGSIFKNKREEHHQGAFPVTAVDTTAAGDTFTGFFLHGLFHEKPIGECLELAAKAASIAVTRPGAAASIPSMDEVLQG